MATDVQPQARIESPKRQKFWFKETFQFYLVLVSIIGICLLGLGLLNIERASILGLLLFSLLAIASSFSGTTTIPELSFEIGSAISAASIPLYGPFGAIIVSTCSMISTWLAVRNTGHSTASFGQLLFNIGAQNITIGIAGGLYLYFYPYTLINPMILLPFVWFIIATVHDQINFWLVMVMLRLQMGPNFKVLEAWKDTRWAMSINILLIWLGGGLIAFASIEFGFTGVLAYFVPVGLSAYAFRLYVQKMQSHMDNLEQIIAERTDELEQLIFEKDAFLAMLTHDMKSPLTSIGLYAQILEKRPEKLIEKPRIASVISQSQQTLLELVNNILDVEKLQKSGEIRINKEYFDFSSLVEAATEAVSPMADQKEIKLHLKSDIQQIKFYGDESQLKRVITNLISNAIKYSPEGSRVTINLKTGQEMILLEVNDQGYGIPEDELPFIFDRYRRVEANKDWAVGTGLGLSIVKAIVDSHQGKITVSSQVDHGSNFCIELPFLSM